MPAIVVALLIVSGVAPLVMRWAGARGFLVLATAPALAAVWAATQLTQATSAHPPAQTVTWVPQLQIELAFRLDSLAWLMTMIVSAIGALILVYCAHYVEPRQAREMGAFAGYLVAFAGTMVGLVTTDDMLTLYVFWELTTVLSYLLIGHHNTLRSSRLAAKQALLLTTFGGLAMLVGMVIIGQSRGTYRISEVLADPGSGTAVSVGVVLVLVGAISKSALIPFHFWLPAAMAAPTPVSAYLHAAAMVKAGVYLIARFAPAYSDLPAWRTTVIVLGASTMLLGAVRALRQVDLKLLLAHGTVSQLGFITLLLGWGTREAATAGLALLLSHALFKSALFLTVGTIEHAAGSRDLRDLDGLARRMPWLAGGALLAALSMAGLPPLLGFVAKEVAYEALLHPESWWSLDAFALLAIVLGSALTLAYSARFVWGAFGPATRAADAPASGFTAPGPLLVSVPVVLGGAGLLLGPLSGPLNTVTEPYAAAWQAGEHPIDLVLWHGLSPALLLSAATWVLGGAVFVLAGRATTRRTWTTWVPDGTRAYKGIMSSIDRAALEVTGAMQRGSLPTLLSVVLCVLVLLVGGQLLLGVTWPAQVRWFDSPAQVAVGLLVCIAAVATARARRRFRAVFLLGATGYGMSMLFLLHGAPDLALTQGLVETVTLVVFVLVLRRLSGRFPDDPGVLTRRLRAGLGIAVSAVVVGLTLSASAVRTRDPSGVGLVERAVDYGGGNNIVNVILVDARAWDTMGELSVVLAAATGVASLVFLRGDAVARAREQLQVSRRIRSQPGAGGAVEANTGWLAAAPSLQPHRRSTILEVVTRLVFHTIVLWSLYLLFSGHNQAGGGFAAGLVCGLALALRYLAGRGYELRLAAPVMPGLLLGAGLFIATAAAVLPMTFGYEPLRTFIWDVSVPLLGEVHLVTSILFDVGVYLVVIGLILDILRSLGSAIDDQISQDVAS